VRRTPLFIAIAAAGLTVAGGLALAQSPPASARLSFTEAQAKAGQAEYAANCTDCHGAALNDGEFGGTPLKGEAFRAKWSGQPVANLIGYIRVAMPPDSPGRLPVESYVDLAAYLLSANGVPAGERPLPTDMDELAKLPIETGKGAVAGDR